MHMGHKEKRKITKTLEAILMFFSPFVFVFDREISKGFEPVFQPLQPKRMFCLNTWLDYWLWRQQANT